jgi:uncharacterized membrane protein
MYNVVFFFHILGVLSLVSGIVVAGVAFETARRREQPAEVATLLGLSRLGAMIVGPGALAAGVFGLWLVHLGNWHYNSFWVDASIVLFVVGMALGGMGGQRPKQARELAVRLASRDAPMTDELRGLLNDRATQLENYGALLMILAIVAIMIFKP